MGIKERSDQYKLIDIKHYSLCMESKEPREGFESRMVPNPSTGEQVQKYLKLFPGFEGMVTRLEWYDTGDEYKERYMGVKIHMEDGGEQYVLRVPEGRRIFFNFCKIVENIDFTKPVEFYAFKDRNSDSTILGASQGGVPVKHRYTLNDPGDCPPGKKNKAGKWSFSDQEEWLTDRLISTIIPAVNEQLGATTTGVSTNGTGSEDRWEDEESAFHTEAAGK